MRLNVVPQISTKDGQSNKNARLTNCLKESKKSGDMAVIRPGLVLDAVASGVGNGLVSFNGELVSVYGSTLGLNSLPASEWANVTGVTNANASSICYGNSKFYILDTGGDFFTTTDLSDVVQKTDPGASYAHTGNVIAAGGGLVCCITNTSTSGDSANVSWSDDDGATWNSVPNAIGNGSIIGGGAYASLHFDGTYFIAAIIDTDDLQTVWRSTDCITWSACGNIISNGHVVVKFATGLGYTYALTDIGACAYTANNGLTWTTHPTLDATRDVGVMVLSGSTLVAFGDIAAVPYIYKSTNGTTFSETNFTSVVGGGGFAGGGIVVSGEIVLMTSSTNYYTSSDDGANWTAKTDSSGAVWNRGTSSGTVGIVLGTASTAASVIGTETNGTIPALTTITGTSFDFAQSPL